MATDIVQRCIEAITAVLDSSAAVQAITSRTTRNCVPYLTGASSEKLPVLLLSHITTSPIGGVGDNRRTRFQVTAVAKGNGSDAVANGLLEAVEGAINHTSLAGQGLDSYVETTRRYRGGSDDGVGRADIDLILIVRNT